MRFTPFFYARKYRDKKIRYQSPLYIRRFTPKHRHLGRIGSKKSGLLFVFQGHIEPIINCLLLYSSQLKLINMDISRETLQYLRYHPFSSRDEIASGTSFDKTSSIRRFLHLYCCPISRHSLMGTSAQLVSPVMLF